MSPASQFLRRDAFTCRAGANALCWDDPMAKPLYQSFRHFKTLEGQIETLEKRRRRRSAIEARRSR